MIKFTAFVVIVAIRIMYHQSAAQSNTTPFASQSTLPYSTITAVPAKFMGVNGTRINNRIILKWMIGNNETAYCFEVEKSTDGKTFTMAALVFGSDKTETDNYMFYEKAEKKKVMYRIKMINKSQHAEYSSVIEINPGV